jgi:DNA polymerase-1
MVGRVLQLAGLVIGHNLKFDEHFARKEGWWIGNRYDTMIASALYNENIPLELETRAERHLGFSNARHWKRQVQDEIACLAKASRMNKTPYLERYGYSEVPISLLGLYACHDGFHTGKLFEFFESKNVSGTYSRIWPTETELTRVLCDMECHGLPVNVPYIKDLRARLLDVQAGYSVRLRQFLGNSFRPGSDADVRDLLYNHYKLEPFMFTRNNAPSVEGDVLKYFSHRIPILQVLRAWREVDKLATTYTDSILRRTDEWDICHPDFQQVGTVSGRMSCKTPNFQNQPVDNKKRAKENGGLDPWSIRRAFIMRRENGVVWPRLYLDYSQLYP